MQVSCPHCFLACTAAHALQTAPACELLCVRLVPTVHNCVSNRRCDSHLQTFVRRLLKLQQLPLRALASRYRGGLAHRQVPWPHQNVPASRPSIESAGARHVASCLRNRAPAPPAASGPRASQLRYCPSARGHQSTLAATAAEASRSRSRCLWRPGGPRVRPPA